MSVNRTIKSTTASVQLSVALACAMGACGGDGTTTGSMLPGAMTAAGAGAVGTKPAAAGSGAVAAPATKPTMMVTVPVTQPSTMSMQTKPATGIGMPVTGAAAGGPAMAAAGAPATAAGAAGAAGGAAANGGTMMTGMGSEGTMATGLGPTLPMIMGECPEFKNGSTIMVAGHRSIQIQVGEAGKGGPVLFYWHGTGSSAAESARFPGNSEIVSMGGIVAAFNGNQSSGAKGDCSGTGAHNMADFDAADQIAACAVKNHGADSRKIYSTGCSAGGLQTGCMAMVRSSYLAAVAPNSGGIVGAQPWQDKHSPAVFTMHGGPSDMVIVTFSQTSASFDMNAKMHGSFVVNCDHGGGHCAAPADLQKSAWQFMKDHPWGTTMSPWMSGFPAGTPNYCKVF